MDGLNYLGKVSARPLYGECCKSCSRHSTLPHPNIGILLVCVVLLLLQRFFFILLVGGGSYGAPGGRSQQKFLSLDCSFFDTEKKRAALTAAPVERETFSGFILSPAGVSK